MNKKKKKECPKYIYNKNVSKKIQNKYGKNISRKKKYVNLRFFSRPQISTKSMIQHSINMVANKIGCFFWFLPTVARLTLEQSVCRWCVPIFTIPHFVFGCDFCQCLHAVSICQVKQRFPLKPIVLLLKIQILIEHGFA